MESVFIQPSVAVLIAFVIAIKSYRRKSLDVTGAVAGFLVMTLHFAISYRFGAILLVFFFTSSKLTKVGEDKKRRFDAEFKEGGQRNWYLFVYLFLFFWLPKIQLIVFCG